MSEYYKNKALIKEIAKLGLPINFQMSESKTYFNYKKGNIVLQDWNTLFAVINAIDRSLHIYSHELKAVYILARFRTVDKFNGLRGLRPESLTTLKIDFSKFVKNLAPNSIVYLNTIQHRVLSVEHIAVWFYKRKIARNPHK